MQGLAPVYSVGTAMVDGKRRKIARCGEKACELLWIPAKIHVPATAPQAA